VSASLYLDTSALIKLYHQEVRTGRMDDLFAQQDNILIISELAVVEFYSMLACRVRIGEITLETQEEASRSFKGAIISRHRSLLPPSNA
jgi:predicted nucleic acid-binding protein